MALNLCQFIGNCGKDPEIRALGNGDEVANLSIGVSESWKDKTTGERKEKTEWVKVVIFNKNLVQLVKSYVKKGSKIYISGKLQTRKWQDQSGQDKYSTEVVLDYNGQIELLSSKSAHDAATTTTATSTTLPAEAQPLDDEIPF
jgi:single-strand DNA-binding protein